MSNGEGSTPKRAKIKQPIKTWNSWPPEIGDVGVHVGISQDRRNIHKGESFPLFYQRGPDPKSTEIQTDCLALDVRSGSWDELESMMSPDWLALEISNSARNIEGLREALHIYYKFGLDVTSETVTAIMFRRLS